MAFRTVSLSEAQSRLLICLLTNHKDVFIYKDDILKKVWDEFNLPSSNQRLWQTVNELRKKLAFVGFADDFITNVHGRGYTVNSLKIESLYIL
jgi:DNA-binding winged helix-turn-helix (wHTH) protein